MYVTLEPCCHHGKQPPCTEAIIEAGIRKVIIGSADPNPLVAGKGVVMLREHGVEVTEGFLKDECDSFNRPFFYFITNGTPYVVLKYAMTADGRIAAHTGSIQMDNRRSGQGKCTSRQEQIYGDHDRSGDGACGRSAADLQDTGRQGSGEDNM